MDKFMAWMENSFAPKMNKLAHNPWVAAVQQAILTAMPMIFIGSFVTVLTAFGGLIEGFPDFSPINTFSIGLLSVFLSYLVPYLIMEKKRNNKTKKEAGLAGIALYLLIAGPVLDGDAGTISFTTSALGNGGMIAALMAGLFAGFVMNLFAKHSFFKEDTAIPDFITVWFDTLIPILIIIACGWIFTFQLHINISDVVYTIFSPVIAVGDSFLGYTLFFGFEYAFLYTFGISTWVLYPIETAIVMNALAVNQAAVAAGQAATMVSAYGSSYYWCIGGGGCTLALGLMMLFFAKSKKLKVIGRTTLVPSLCNINEPLVFGAPIAFNPILMVPMWIIGFAGPAITWLALHFGLVECVSTLFSFWYLPDFIPAYAVGGVAGVILFCVIFALSCLVYFPFFKIYDKQCVEEERAEFEEKEARLEKKRAREARNAARLEADA